MIFFMESQAEKFFHSLHRIFYRYEQIFGDAAIFSHLNNVFFTVLPVSFDLPPLLVRLLS